ncbi:hypothetical protein HY571_02175 [Candidatus Micrarchaeota archaeon]|nr:hypothetical protein [Candidatus Micrarchaeota archaeon]
MGIFSFGKKPVADIIKEGAKSEADLKRLIEEACSKGAVHANFYIDAHGRDEKAVENVLIEAIASITKAKNVLFCKGEIEHSVEAEGLFSSFATVEVVTADFNALVNLFLTYAPASVEILQPQKLVISLKQAHDILLDAALNTQKYSKYIMENVMNEEQKKDFAERLRRKTEYGAKMREKAEKSTQG